MEDQMLNECTRFPTADVYWLQNGIESSWFWPCYTATFFWLWQPPKSVPRKLGSSVDSGMTSKGGISSRVESKIYYAHWVIQNLSKIWKVWAKLSRISFISETKGLFLWFKKKHPETVLKYSNSILSR